MFITNSKDYYVRFYSVEYDEPQFIGPFDSEDVLANLRESQRPIQDDIDEKSGQSLFDQMFGG